MSFVEIYRNIKSSEIYLTSKKCDSLLQMSKHKNNNNKDSMPTLNIWIRLK